MSTFSARVEAALARGQVRAIDAALAQWCLRHGAEAPVALAMLLTHRALGDGHACVDLDGEAPSIPGESAVFCSGPEFLAALERSALVGGPGDARPLIRDGARLYLHRYWGYEERLAAALRERLAQPPAPVDPAPLGRDGGLFDHGWLGDAETNWQAVAAAAALRHRFVVISGGPGTGKTYTVLRLIRLLMDAAGAAGAPDPLIRLAAPTGKAAARMMESIRQGLDALPDADALRARLPEEATTLHRLLGLREGSVQPRHDRANPLAADAVIVDEASMVDLPMMAKLVDAVPARARLVLLGDRYQLASVESGSVLAELCSVAGINAFSAAQRQALAPLLRADATGSTADGVPLADHVVTLRTSHRFHPDSPIGRFAAAVNDGRADLALDAAAGASEIRIDTAPETDLEALAAEVARQYSPLFVSPDPGAALDALDRMRLLTATRVGPAGTLAMNRRILRILAETHGFDPERTWFPGRPVIVLRNDYGAGLYNGDTGVCLRAEDGGLRVWFRSGQGPRGLLPGTIPEHETVFAMTVHKSQGSEFSDVHLLLPSADTPLLTRELVYTGVTRARRHLALHAPPDVFAAAISRRVVRRSGLADRLRGALQPLPDAAGTRTGETA